MEGETRIDQKRKRTALLSRVIKNLACETEYHWHAPCSDKDTKKKKKKKRIHAKR